MTGRNTRPSLHKVTFLLTDLIICPLPPHGGKCTPPSLPRITHIAGRICKSYSGESGGRQQSTHTSTTLSTAHPCHYGAFPIFPGHLSHLRISLGAIGGALSHPPLPPGYYGNTDFCTDTSQIDGRNAITFVLMTGIRPVPSSDKEKPPRLPHINTHSDGLSTGHMLRTHGHIPLALISRALISLQGRKEGFRELFPTLSRSVHAAVMLRLSLDPGIYAVFQLLHCRQKKLHLYVTRRGVFPAWCMWSRHVQRRV